MKQTGYRHWLGAIQIQVQNAAFYDSFVSMAMLALTMWHTTGSVLAQTYAPWFTIWAFLGLGVAYKIIAMILDYKYMYPSRVGFISEQAYKPYNPTVVDIQSIKADIVLIKKSLGIVDEGERRIR